MSGIELLIDDRRCQYIPRDFVQGFNLEMFSGIRPEDVVTCGNPESDWYWEAWNNIVDNATYQEHGHTWHLYQDGALFAYCPELMTDSEHEEFFGEPREIEEES